MTSSQPACAPGGPAGWVMVNCAGETLTESSSGGIAAWILGACRAAAQDGVLIPVVTKRHTATGAAWEHALELDYPWPSFSGHSHVDRQVLRRLQYVHPWQPLWNRRVVAALRRLVPEPCNVLLHNDPELAVVVSRALPRHRVWHLLHNTNPIGVRWHVPFAERVQPLAVSAFLGRWLGGHLGSAGRGVQVVPGGVDTDVFVSGPKGHPPIVSYAGLFNERKAPDLLLSACERIAVRRPDLHFSVNLFGATHYGPEELDDYGRGLRDAAARLRARGIDVQFPGFLPRQVLAGAMTASAIHVVPSRCEEAFGLAALEGMACGAATVVADLAGLPEVVGDAGVLVAPNDVEALAALLCRLLIDGVEREALGARGRSRAEGMSWGDTWRRLRDLDDPARTGSRGRG